MSLVSTHNEWDPLEEVVVGSALGAQWPRRRDRSMFALYYRDCGTHEAIPAGPFPRRVIEETEEELAELCGALVALGVTVRRPALPDPAAVMTTPDWETDGFYDHAPRDCVLIVGDTMVEAPLVGRPRYLHALRYRSLLLEYFDSGARWVAAPRPRLADEMYAPECPEGSRLCDLEPCFEAANVLRIGTDLLYLLSDGGNAKGARWLESVLGPGHTVHVCRNLYASAHVDTTIMPLRPGLVLLNPERVNEDNLPPLFASWDRLWCPELVDIPYVGEHSLNSIWIGMNVLMVRPDLAIVDRRQPALIRALEARHIDVLPLQITHARTLGGGFHCATLDVRRSGELECYR
jgi:scyllo-inosamine-4-phosphate amidinotransferase 1